MNAELFFKGMVQFLLYYAFLLPFIELLFCWHEEKRKRFPLRCLVFLGYLYLFHIQFLPYSPWSAWGTFIHLPFLQYGPINVAYLLEFLVSVLLLLFCFRISVWKAAFWATASYTVQNLGHIICELIRIYFYGEGSRERGRALGVSYHGIIFLVHAVLLCAAYYLLVKRYQSKQDVMVDHRFIAVFSTAAVAIVCLFNWWTYQAEMRNLVYYINMAMIDLLLLGIQFGYFERACVLSENAMVEQLLHMQAKQQEQKRENEEILNQKYHDLKHQLSALRSMEQPLLRNEVISELEKTLGRYDSVVRCGNPALDVVLTEKSRLCEAGGIHFSCIVDGSVLLFMRELDLCSLFGNALDNAIEAVRKVSEPDERVITLRTEKKGAVIKIFIENSCGEPVLFKDGFPITSKEDTAYHGYGIRSMKYIAEQYGGSMGIRVQDGRFRLSFLFPDNRES